MNTVDSLKPFMFPIARRGIKPGRVTRAVGVLVLFSLASMVAQAATITYQDATANGDSANIKDTFMRYKTSSDTDLNCGATPNTTNPPTPYALGQRWYGDGNTQVKRHWLFQFDLLNMPTGARIVGADLNLWMQPGAQVQDGAARGGNVARVLKTWIEGTKNQTTASTGEPTWSHSAYSTTTWGTAGATGAADIDTATALAVTVQAADSSANLFLQQFSVSPIVESWLPDSGTGTSNYGMLLYGGTWGNTDSGSTACYGICPSETTQTSYRPKLTVTITIIADRGPGSMSTTCVPTATTNSITTCMPNRTWPSRMKQVLLTTVNPRIFIARLPRGLDM